MRGPVTHRKTYARVGLELGYVLVEGFGFGGLRLGLGL